MKNSITAKRRTLRIVLLSLFSIFMGVLSCKKDVAIPDSSFGMGNQTIQFLVPENWPQPSYSFQDNPLTQEGFELGRKLFYETRLSRDNTVSCGTCHQSFAAFANADHPVSHGVDGLLGKRNSPPLFNLNWYTSFFWDGGVNHLELQPVAPITNPVEMDETLDNIIVKLKNDAVYPSLFRAAFKDTLIDSQKLLFALTQFMGSMISSNSKYDKYQRNEPGGDMNVEELAGLAVYEAKCAECHKAPLFTDFSFRNIGLTPSSFKDSGRAHITLLSSDLYKFKVPSLRNLGYSAPYMHDGRFSTLDQVFDQMETGIYLTPTVDPLMANGIKLSAKERSDLKAFLKTLDDTTFVKDQRFFEPTK